MGIFSTQSPFDPIVEKVTDENKKDEDWGMIMEVCDRVGATTTGPKECLRSILKRLQHQDPHVVEKALVLLDACISNCGQYFLMEVASRDFETEYKRLLPKSHPKIQERLKSLLKKWAENEFSTDPKYNLIPSLYAQLKRDGHSFSGADSTPKKEQLPKDPLVVSSKQEEDDIAKAIQLSLQENSGHKKEPSSSSASALYPTDVLYSGGAVASGGASGQTQQVKEKRARCLYDFEAAEDNELTFKAGEMVVILDDEDPNWWKGSNHRGEGLFPANFVTLDLEPEVGADRRKSVQFNEEVEVKTVEPVTFPTQTTIDQDKISELLEILHEADPTEETDPPQLPRLEEQVDAMSPLIDAELERVDRRHAQLTRLSHELVDALSLYHTLMREMPPLHAAGGMPLGYPGGGGGYMMPGGGNYLPPGMQPPGGMLPPLPQQQNQIMHGGVLPSNMPPHSGAGANGMMPPMSTGAAPNGILATPPHSSANGMMLHSAGSMMPPHSMASSMMPPHSMAGGMMPLGGGQPQTMGYNQPPMPGGGGGGAPNSMPPMYYMDPQQGAGAPQQMFPGSAPPPTPPLHDTDYLGSQAQGQQHPVYSHPNQ